MSDDPPCREHAWQVRAHPDKTWKATVRLRRCKVCKRREFMVAIIGDDNVKVSPMKWRDPPVWPEAWQGLRHAAGRHPRGVVTLEETQGEDRCGTGARRIWREGGKRGGAALKKSSLRGGHESQPTTLLGQMGMRGFAVHKSRPEVLAMTDDELAAHGRSFEE